RDGRQSRPKSGQPVLGVRARGKNPREGVPYLLVVERARSMDGVGQMGSIRQSHSINKATRQAAAGSGAQGRGGAASPKVLRQYISRFPQASVLVIGDLILDHYIWGRVSRISPEAPVPVVHVDSESLKLGGAANVFNNIQALGGKADLCGVIGSDESGRMLLKELGSTRSGRGGDVTDQDREPTRQTRVSA